MDESRRLDRVRDRYIAIAFFFLVFLTKLPLVNTPFHWDDLGEGMQTALFVFNHRLSSLWVQGPLFSGSHPPFLDAMLGLAWVALGFSIQVSHLVIFSFAFLGIYFTYRLGKKLFGFSVGLLAALWLFFSPLYFAQAGTMNRDLPFAALLVITMYYALVGKRWAYLFSGLSFILTKVYGIFFIPVILLATWRQRNGHVLRIPWIKNIVWPTCFILMAFFIWLVHHQLRDGWVIYPSFKKVWIWHPYLLPGIKDTTGLLSGKIHAYLIEPFRFNFFDKGKFILTACVFFAVYCLRSRAAGFTSFLWLVVCAAIFRLSIYLPPGSFILFFLFFVFSSFMLLAYRNARLSPLILLIFSGILVSFSFALMRIAVLPRYWLFSQPFYFLVAAYALVEIAGKKKILLYGFAFCFIVLSMAGWRGERKGLAGWQLESNLEYLDQIKTHKEACRFIEESFPDSTVLTSWPQEVELKGPPFGYVSKPIKVVPKEFWFTANEKGIDVVYFSPQSDRPERMLRAMRKFQLEEVQRYESHGKEAVIYKVKKTQ
jgi:hypothetical protein